MRTQEMGFYSQTESPVDCRSIALSDSNTHNILNDPRSDLLAFENNSDSHASQSEAESLTNVEAKDLRPYTPYTPCQLVGALQDVVHKRKVGKITKIKVLLPSGKK